MGLQEMGGLLMDTCNNVLWEGSDPEGYQLPTSTFNPPVGGDQTANVVITGDSSNIVFEECHVGPGAGTFGRSRLCASLWGGVGVAGYV